VFFLKNYPSVHAKGNNGKERLHSMFEMKKNPWEDPDSLRKDHLLLKPFYAPICETCLFKLDFNGDYYSEFCKVLNILSFNFK